MDNAFYGGGCPYFGHLIQYYWLLTTAILAQIKVCLAAIMGWWQQVRDMETLLTPQNPSHVSLNEGKRPLKQWIGFLMEPHTHMPVQAGPTGSSQLGGSEAGFGLVWPE